MRDRRSARHIHRLTHRAAAERLHLLECGRRILDLGLSTADDETLKRYWHDRGDEGVEGVRLERKG
jgi:hypothetical protein